MNLSSMKNAGRLRTCAYGWGSLATIIFISGVVLSMLDANNFTKQLTASSMVLTEGSVGMKFWISPPTPVIFKVYFWNVTNPSEVLSGEKPKLIEVGPYIYEKTLRKVEAVIEENDTLVYREHNNLSFSESLTGNLRKDTDVITILHLPIMGMILRVYEIAPEYVSFLDGVWSTLFPTSEDIFMRGTVKDILFDGIPIDCHSNDFMVTTVCNNMEESPPPTIRNVGNKDFRFSFFHHKNCLSSYTMRVYRGVDDLSRLKQMVSFNDQVTINKWHNKYCDMINGSDGSQYPPNLQPHDVIYMFQPDLCRSLYAKYEQELYLDGLQLFRFVTTPDLFASAEENPNNECYCIPKAQLSDLMGGGGGGSEVDPDEEPPLKTCLKSGGMLLTPCVGAPLAATFPHFYLADKSYSQLINLSPRKELHETFVDVEPLTGVPIRGSKRLQFNMEVKAIPEMPLLANITPGFFPILWVDETMMVSKEVISVFRKVQWVNRNINKIGYITGGIGLFLIIIVSIWYKKTTGTWNAGGAEAETGGYDNHGYGLYGQYTNRTKLPIDGTAPTKTNGLGLDYPVLMRRNGGRVYPNNQNAISGMYAENFM